ncbi:MAG TPA: neutral/alkaline non-lysosomal ceramidase N-terminal domain-containing protein, partial [Prosthecobacter sp.]|nr:neutral/alkaline non-lysosomal ceramidase N-terminal domain-containing protein [Prosthecobacter sp.]
SAKITPAQMMWMAGYASRNKPAEGVEQDLYAKALVIQDASGGQFALITLDLIGVPRNLRLFVAGEVQKKYGIEPARLAINASHTHSGPELRVTRTDKTDDPVRREAEAKAYVEKLQQTLVGLVGQARENMRVARLDFSTARCGFAMNRRTPEGTGWKNFPNPEGPVDHTVPVLKVANADGDKDIAYVFGYACHCTTLGHQKFSGDYAGYAQEALQKAHPGVIAMFMNGCSGDQNPYPRRTTELAQTHGKSLATAVEAALTTQLRPISGLIRAAYKEIPLAYDTLPTREQLVEKQKSKTKLDADHATRMLELLDEEGKLPTEYPYPVQVVRIGPDLTWVTLAGEVVIDYALRLKKEIKDPIVWVSGYTNDVPTYIPSLRVWQEGGYEGGDAMKWGQHPTRWHPKVEEHIISTVMELRKQVE